MMMTTTTTRNKHKLTMMSKNSITNDINTLKNTNTNNMNITSNNNNTIDNTIINNNNIIINNDFIINNNNTTINNIFITMETTYLMFKGDSKPIWFIGSCKTLLTVKLIKISYRVGLGAWLKNKTIARNTDFTYKLLT